MREQTPDAARLERLRDYFAQHQVLPSYSGIADLMRYGSKAAAFKLVNRLTEAGFLRKGPGQRLAPTDEFFGRRLVGSVRAGMPDVAPDVQFENVTLDRYLIDRPSQMVLVRVKGESMVEAGILPGDLVAVDCGRQPKRGDIVVVLWEDGITIKELDYERGRPILRPRNASMPVLRPENGLQVLGVYTGLVRKHARK
jgi:SOS-response transcriptional repressor LexA